MKASQNCLTLIKKYEGLYLNAYLCPADILTIGYGTIKYPNGNLVKLKDKITEAQAEEYLVFECKEIAKVLNSLIKVNINQNQFDALMSFCYNLGVGAFERSTLFNLLNKGDIMGAANEFERWVYATKNGVRIKLPGLIKRRKDEAELFVKDI